jgi:dystonin
LNNFVLLQLLHDIDDLLDWFKDTERQIEEAEPVCSEPDDLRKQLVQQKTLNDDINSQKSKARDVISAGKRLRRESSSVLR